MLKITSDGRKLGLDQRIVNQMLPDEPGTKVNQCVENIMQIWRDGEADKMWIRDRDAHNFTVPSGVYQSGSHTAPSAAKLPVSVRKPPDTSPL